MTIAETRRRFLTHFASLGLGSTLLPGVLWARMQDAGAQAVTLDMLTDALRLSGIDLGEDDRRQMVEAANRHLTQLQELRAVEIPNDVSPPFHFSPIVPGMTVDRSRQPFRMSRVPALKPPATRDELAFWPVRHLAELVRTKQVSSVELTQLYLERLHRHNATLNNVVTFLDDLGLAEARRADGEIAAGRYRGPLHGIPWGAKDIISVRGVRTTWGAAPFQDQQFDYDASVVEMLREAGAVLIAKLATGELAAGDNWFGGQTKSPWDPAQGSSGSSAGPGSATAAGGVGFAIGTETSGSILSPSARNGLAGLRPTFGRVSRYGVMALSWTQDRLGPMCRHAEDCALVMQAIARPDGRDLSVTDVPFNWNADRDVRRLRVGIIEESFDEITSPEARANAERMLDQLRAIGVREFVPVRVPEVASNVSAIGVESAAFFDRYARAGRMKGTRSERPTGRLWSAVDYLQSQRLRMMMMMALAAATADVDVYIVGSGSTGVGRPGGSGERGAGAGAATVAAAGGEAGTPAGGGRPPRPQTPAERHFGMANLAGYPAVNLPNGFASTGTPTNATLYAQPYREADLLALAVAYQDAARHHLVRPSRLDG